MPWFPDFVGAVELVRAQTQVAGQADPIGQYVAALNRGDTRALEDVWPRDVVVYDPRAGEVRGHRALREFVRRSKAILAERHARTETLTEIVAGGRAVVELLAHLNEDGHELAWPVALVAESPKHQSVVFRSYFSQRALDGKGHLRRPFLESVAVDLPDIASAFQFALAAGDVDAIVTTFAPDGYVRQPFGPHSTHRGRSELRALFGDFFGGGIRLEPCAVTDDGVRCAVEYNCAYWGGHDVPPQAGIVVYERDPAGLLAAARLYDDIDPR